MRVLVGAAAALLFAASAAAQPAPATPAPPAPPSTCGDVPAQPALPDPAHATAAQMTRGNQTFEAWATDARAKLQCRANEVRTLEAQAQAAGAAYNAQAAAFTSTVNSWTAATTAYNNQHGASSSNSRHERGSVMGSGHN